MPLVHINLGREKKLADELFGSITQISNDLNLRVFKTLMITRAENLVAISVEEEAGKESLGWLEEYVEFQLSLKNRATETAVETAKKRLSILRERLFLLIRANCTRDAMKYSRLGAGASDSDSDSDSDGESDDGGAGSIGDRTRQAFFGEPSGEIGQLNLPQGGSGSLNADNGDGDGLPAIRRVGVGLN